MPPWGRILTVRLFMRFRVTSVTDEEVSTLLRDVTVRLEDILNSLLGDGDFGDAIDQLTLVVVSVDDDEVENSKWLKAHNRLGSYKDFVTSEPKKYLSLGVSIAPSQLLKLEEQQGLSLVSKEFTYKLGVRPARLPRGLDFQRLSSAVQATLQVYAARDGR